MKRKQENTSSDSNTSHKKQKQYDTKDSKVGEIPSENRLLDNLTRLFQMTSQGCAAACLIDQTIVIADNEIYGGTTGTGNKFNLIQTVMKYFSDLANEREGHKESREEVFKKICVARLKGEAEGYIKLEDTKFAEIAKNVLDTYKKEDQENWRLQYIKTVENYQRHETQHVVNAYEIVGLLARDFLKIEQFISDNKNNDKNDLVAAFKGQENEKIFIDQACGISEKDKGLIQYGEDPGYIILNIDEKGVHAEAKIIEYLILTDVINNLVENEKIYIGISKLCCKGCASFIKAVNEVFCSKIEIIETRGVHGLQPTWTQPMICQDYSNEQVKGYRVKEGKEVSVSLTSKRPDDKCDKYVYLVDKETIKKLKKLAPELKKVLGDEGLVSQVVYSHSSAGSQSPSTHDEIEEKLSLGKATPDQLLNALLERYSNPEANDLIVQLQVDLKRFTEKREIEIIDPDFKITPSLDKEWYTYELIVSGLRKKGIPVDNLLLPVSTNHGLEIALVEKINKKSCVYMIPLNVDPINGNLGSTNHWVGLYITTNADAKIDSIKYINPIGQSINQELALKILSLTGANTEANIEDLTEGKGIQFAFSSKESGTVALEGNDYDCGPMLVQFFWELMNHGKICTHSLRLDQSIEFGQKCRKEQRWDEAHKELLQKWWLINLACNNTVGRDLHETETWYDLLLLKLFQIDLSGASSETHTDSLI